MAVKGYSIYQNHFTLEIFKNNLKKLLIAMTKEAGDEYGIKNK